METWAIPNLINVVFVLTAGPAFWMTADCFFESEVFIVGKRNIGLELQKEIPAGARDFSFLQKVQTYSGANPESSMCTAPFAWS